MQFSTKAIHVGQEADPSTGATILPIYQTSTYTQEEIGKTKGYEYSRTGNPTRASLEKCLASLENAEYGSAFSSGLAASTAILSVLLKPGDHVIAMDDLYGGTYRLFETIFKPFGIQFTYVDGTKIDEFYNNLTESTKMIWLETPSNPLLRLVDLKAVSTMAQKHHVCLVVDNTFATPYLQQPLVLGADVIIHSTTKYIGGHSDVVGGAVLTNNPEIDHKVKYYQNAAGAILGPFDSWLTLRGLKTLAIRMEQHQKNAMIIAKMLCQRADVLSVHYPGLENHPQHDLAKIQMKGFGGMVSFQLIGGFEEANMFMKSLNLFSLAESLGGVESLACYPAKMTHGSIPQEEREKRGITDGLIRLSVGIEEVEDLLADLEQAFTKVKMLTSV